MASKFASLASGFMEGATFMDDLMTKSLKRRLDMRDAARQDSKNAADIAYQNSAAEVNRANVGAMRAKLPWEINDLRYKDAQSNLSARFLGETYSDELAYRKKQLQIGIEDLRNKGQLMPKQSQLASAQTDYAIANTQAMSKNLPAQSDLNNAQATYGLADLKRNAFINDIGVAATTSDVNNVLRAHNRDYYLEDMPDGTVSIKDKSGKQLGDALPYEQAMYLVKNPSAYSADTVSAMLQADYRKPTPPRMMPPVVNASSSAKPSANSNASVYVPPNLGITAQSQQAAVEKSAPRLGTDINNPFQPADVNNPLLKQNRTIWGGY